MFISLIVAMDDNGVIGADGGLPWRLSADLKHFKEVTMGKPIVMGRRTHESIGRPLPGRENIVLTRDQNYKAEGCTVLHSIDDLFIHCRYHEEVMIMGGAELYRQFLDRAHLIYLTEVHARVEGDTYFPDYNPDIWDEVAREDFRADEDNEYDYSFVVLKKES
ncbi:MAG: type 3 dihydrofolate reductase [Gammaproteobacteria bacterium]